MCMCRKMCEYQECLCVCVGKCVNIKSACVRSLLKGELKGDLRGSTFLMVNQPVTLLPR